MRHISGNTVTGVQAPKPPRVSFWKMTSLAVSRPCCVVVIVSAGLQWSHLGLDLR